MSGVVRKNVCLDSMLVEEVNRIVRAKGGAKKGYTFSSELTVALREHVRRYHTQQEETLSAPVWERVLSDKLNQQEDWLRPGVWGASVYSATASLLLLELMCGKTIDPREAKEHFELIRGRAWKMVRRQPDRHRGGES